MKVLWLCNFMLPMVAEKLGREATNKEGWISGLASVLLARQQENGLSLALAFPVERSLDGYREQIELENGAMVECFGFYEDTVHPERYDEGLEERLREILELAEPDVIHCFGTEYPHTLAMCKAAPRPERVLLGIQGLCAVYADAYYSNLPEKVRRSATLRDILRRDTLRMQQEKFVRRGAMEMEAVRRAGNVTGRTEWDRYYTKKWHPDVEYFMMNETLRKDFYEEQWSVEQCKPHAIFLSQGDYPIKGLHYMLLAMPDILSKYPDAEVYVGGNRILRDGSLTDRLKESAYGRYLRKLLADYGLTDKVHFLGKLNAEEMKAIFLSAHTFVCCSSIENSPNSLGEAMLLGMPCVTALVGGVGSIFHAGQDGISYAGFDETRPGEEELSNIAGNLANAVTEMWDNEEKCREYCENARRHAGRTHNREENYRRLLEIYDAIVRK